MEKLSLRKQLGIVRLYLGGLSYDEIAVQAGVSKGTVANVVGDLKAGRVLDVQGPAEQLELLRELAVDLRRCRLTPGQAAAGLAVLSRLQAVGVEPGDIESWVAMCRELAAQETEPEVFVRAALALEELKKSTGLSAEALEQKVSRLQKEVVRLESIAGKLKGCQQELEELTKRRQKLADEVGHLEKRYQPLSGSVAQKEQREKELSDRVQELEQRAQDADERLAAARKELEALADLGLSFDDLCGFVQRMSGVAQRHAVKPRELRDRLLHELEELEAGLGLESRLNMRREELKNVEQDTVKAQEERKALEPLLKHLREQQAALRLSIAEEHTHVRKETQAIARIAKDATAELRQNLETGMAEALLEVRKLRDQALELGQELGQYQVTIEGNEWLRSLLALVKGHGDVGGSQVRAIGLSVLSGVKDWLEKNQKNVQLPYLLRTSLDRAIEEMTQWKA